MYKILHPSNLETAWPTIEPWLRQAVDPYSQEVDLEYIKQHASQGLCMVLLGYHPENKELDLVLVGEAKFVGGVSTFVIMWAAGKGMDSWIKDIGIVENFAKSKGFKYIQVWGRKGFEKSLKPEGYRHEFTVLGKSLDHGVH